MFFFLVLKRSDGNKFWASNLTVETRNAITFLITNPNFLKQQADGEDELKKRQLMELAIINGTYRDSSTKTAAAGNIYNNY